MVSTFSTITTIIMYVYALVGGVIAYALYKERQALGCPNIPDGTDCDNANGKAVKGTIPLDTDDNQTIFSKIKEAADFADKWVMWRIALLSSAACSLLIYFLIDGRLPTDREAVLTMLIITSVIYFIMNFYKFHLINYARNNIVDGIDIISRRSVL